MKQLVARSYIHGQWVPRQNEQMVEYRNPANIEQVIGKAQFAHSSQITQAVSSATQAFDKWANMAVEKRAELLSKFLERIWQKRSDLKRMITLENGKTLSESESEIASAYSEGKFQLKYIRNKLTEEGKGLSAIRYDPVGVSVLLTPWNFPIATIIRKLVPALMCGNTVIVKPSELTPFSAGFLFEQIHAVRFPEGTANLLIGEGSAVGSNLIKHPEIKAISLTGGTPTGKALLKEVGEKGIRFQAELGGSNAAIIWEDADLQQAARDSIQAGLACCGQWCTGTTRLIIARPVYEQFLNLLKERMQRIVLEDGQNPKTTMGPLISERQLLNMKSIVKRAMEQGARLLCGGKQPSGLTKGHFFEPTLLADLTQHMEIVKEEIFGPILLAFPIDDFDHALELVNDSPFGLSASIYTKDHDLAENFVAKADVGLCHVNFSTGYRLPELPVLGRKDSGIGWPEAGRFALDFFTQPKAVYRNLL